MREIAREEARELEERRAALEARLQDLIAPRDELADKPAIVEIRAGTGGEEAALFAADLFRMYSRFAEKRGWKIEVMEASGTELGGFREIVFSVDGRRGLRVPALGVGRAPRAARPRHRGARAESIRARSPWPSSPRWRRPRSRSATRTSAST